MATCSSSSFSPSVSSFSNEFKYDVFLSFRGTDTRFSFIGNLYQALCDKGIHTFIDDRELKGGEEITPTLVKAIEDSRIFIPVFSNNYASSSFCLDELEHIIRCVKLKGRLVLPIFYGIEPTHVRHQTGSYGEAIAKHEARFQNNNRKHMHPIHISLVLFLFAFLLYSYGFVVTFPLILLFLVVIHLQNKKENLDNMERLRKWKMALTHAANLSGHHYDLRNGYEHEFIGRIVKYISEIMNDVHLHVADYPVGLHSQVLEVNSLLEVGLDDKVQMIGIYGIGGIGKTTLAKALYNFSAHQFEGLCFLHNVRENSAKHSFEHLQEELLKKLFELEIKLGDVSKGIPLIKQRLKQKKVLLVLDDIDKLKQLKVLAGGLDWFRHGSRVIITTRDKNLLSCHGIEKTYEVKELNEKDALELLRWKAFKTNTVDSSYDYVLNRAVTYASGLPLALEVVGSNLFGKPIEDCESTVDQYKKIPDKEIQKILKVSFDSLMEREQSVFLDIACCFGEYPLLEVEDILYAHYGDCVKYHIRLLVQKSLIKITQYGYTPYVTLHDLIEDMGKEIVRQESPTKPGKRSRLWFHKDIVQVLEDNTGTSKIEIIHLDLPKFEVVEWKGDELKKMKNLKTLIIKSRIVHKRGKNCIFSKGPEHLPNSLRVLKWPKCPSQTVPPDFRPKKLSLCMLKESDLTSFQLVSSFKGFVNMRELNLDYCEFLTQILDVSNLPNLELLSFQHCPNLLRVHQSVGFLSKLKFLDAQYCIKLESFPPLELISLHQLNLSCCCNIRNFPEILREMKNITEINLQLTSIEELPLSFQNFTGLQRLKIHDIPNIRIPSSILMLPKLSEISLQNCCLSLPKRNGKLSSMVSTSVLKLHLKRCNLSDEILPILLSWFPNVEELDLSENDFTILPKCLKKCCFLKRLYLDFCFFLQEIRGIPPNLNCLRAEYCKSLTSSCRRMLLNQRYHEAGSSEFILAGFENIPKWFEHQRTGHSISFWFRNKIPSVALFFATKSIHNKHYGLESLRWIVASLIVNGYKICMSIRGQLLDIQPDHTYLFDLKQLQKSILESKLERKLLNNKWIHVEVRYEFWYSNECPIEDWKEDAGADGDGDEDDKNGDKEDEKNNEDKMKEEEIPLFIKSGIHIFSHKNSMEDIRFTNPSQKNEES